MYYVSRYARYLNVSATGVLLVRALNSPPKHAKTLTFNSVDTIVGAREL